MKVIEFLKKVQNIPLCYRKPLIEDEDLENLIAQIEVLYSDIERLTTERDEAVNCIYSIQTALENGNTTSAMEEIITYNFRLNAI